MNKNKLKIHIVIENDPIFLNNCHFIKTFTRVFLYYYIILLYIIICITIIIIIESCTVVRDMYVNIVQINNWKQTMYG